MCFKHRQELNKLLFHRYQYKCFTNNHSVPLFSSLLQPALADLLHFLRPICHYRSLRCPVSVQPVNGSRLDINIHCQQPRQVHINPLHQLKGKKGSMITRLSITLVWLHPLQFILHNKRQKSKTNNNTFERRSLFVSRR